MLEGPALRPETHWIAGGSGYKTHAPSVLRIPRRKADVTPTFLLTGERPASGANPRQEFARMLTSHPQFAKATVNLLWSAFMTVGIVDPPFGWDLARQDPANPPPAPLDSSRRIPSFSMPLRPTSKRAATTCVT